MIDGIRGRHKRAGGVNLGILAAAQFDLADISGQIGTSPTSPAGIVVSRLVFMTTARTSSAPPYLLPVLRGFGAPAQRVGQIPRNRSENRFALFDFSTRACCAGAPNSRSTHFSLSLV